MKRYQAIAFLLSTAMTVSTAVPAFAAASDINGHWAQATIEAWQNEGRIGGYEDGTFRPDQSITRAEFVRLLNSAVSTQGSAAISFSDVSPSDWYYNDVAKAVGNNIASGFEDGTFKPNETVTRMQAAVFISNALMLTSNEAGANGFTDAAQLPAWAKGAVGAVVAGGYMSGYPDGSFGGSRGMTRAEAVSTLDRVLKGGNTTQVPSDPTEPTTPDTSPEESTSNEGNMVWQSGGKGSSSSSGGGGGGGGGSSSSDDSKYKNVTINASNVSDYAGKTLTGTTSVYVDENGIDLSSIKFNGDVRIYAQQSTATASAYDDVAVAAVYLSDIKVKFGSSSVSGDIIVVSNDIADSQVVIESAASIKALEARTATKVAGSTSVTTIKASASIATEEGTTVNTIEATTGASIDVAGSVRNIATAGQVDEISIKGSASPKVSVEGTVTQITLSGTAKADITVENGATIDKIVSTSTQAGTTVSGNGTVTQIVATDPSTITNNTETPVEEIKAESIAVSSQPTKLSYKENETLDLTGLVVTVTYTGGTTKDVALADFTAEGITTTPANGATLTAADNGKGVTITMGTLTATTSALTVEGATTPGVDKAALQTAITTANSAKEGVVTSVDGTDVAQGTYWVTTDVMSTFEAAITTAQGVYDKAEATAEEVSKAVTDLNAATETFNQAKQKGTKAPITEENMKAELAKITGLGTITVGLNATEEVVVAAIVAKAQTKVNEAYTVSFTPSSEITTDTAQSITVNGTFAVSHPDYNSGTPLAKDAPENVSVTVDSQEQITGTVEIRGAAATKAVVGDVLTATAQSSNVGTAVYAWDGAATTKDQQTYTVDAADAGKTLTVTITDANLYGKIKGTIEVASTDTSLASVTVNGETATTSDQTKYTVELDATTDLTTLDVNAVVATATDTNAKVGTVTKDLSSNADKAVFKFTVTAEDGTTSKEYTVEVTKAASSATQEAVEKSVTLADGNDTITLTIAGGGAFASGIASDKFTVTGNDQSPLTVSNVALSSSGTVATLTLSPAVTGASIGTGKVVIAKDAFTAATVVTDTNVTAVASTGGSQAIQQDVTLDAITVNQDDDTITLTITGGGTFAAGATSDKFTVSGETVEQVALESSNTVAKLTITAADAENASAVVTIAQDAFDSSQVVTKDNVAAVSSNSSSSQQEVSVATGYEKAFSFEAGTAISGSNSTEIEVTGATVVAHSQVTILPNSATNGITAVIEDGTADNKVKVTFSGTPTAIASAETYTVTIPAAAITADTNYTAKELTVDDIKVTVTGKTLQKSDFQVSGNDTQTYGSVDVDDLVTYTGNVDTTKAGTIAVSFKDSTDDSSVSDIRTAPAGTYDIYVTTAGGTEYEALSTETKLDTQLTIQGNGVLESLTPTVGTNGSITEPGDGSASVTYKYAIYDDNLKNATSQKGSSVEAVQDETSLTFEDSPSITSTDNNKYLYVIGLDDNGNVVGFGKVQITGVA